MISPLRVVKLSLTAAAIAASWYFTAEYKDATWQARIDAQKIQASTTLADATLKVLETERKSRALSNKQDVEYAKSKEKLQRAYDDNRALAAKFGGMRDPGDRGNGPCTMPSKSGSSIPTSETPCPKLSPAAEAFLHALARDANAAALTANQAYEWAK